MVGYLDKTLTRKFITQDKQTAIADILQLSFFYKQHFKKQGISFTIPFIVKNAQALAITFGISFYTIDAFITHHIKTSLIIDYILTHRHKQSHC
jgi:hypothetical protein